MTGCSHAAENICPQFVLPLTRADIADFLGLTIETVSRQITKLKTAGVVDLIDNRLFSVSEMDRLAEAAGQEWD